MSHTDTLAALGDIIRRVFRQPDAEIARDTVAPDIDGWDSLSHTVLMLEVEKAFGIELPVERMFDLENVGALADLVDDVKATG